MSVLTNKHMIVAVIVAPLLAVLSYYGIGYLFGEKPQVAREGQSYPLAEKPNCRWESGRCGLKNADFELELSVSGEADELMAFQLDSALPLEGVMIALARPGDEEPKPKAMRQADADGLIWTIDLDRPQSEQDRLQLVAAAGHSYWYGDVSTAFTEK